MKVVLFCGGRGMRLRGYSKRVPKPMVHIGYRPVLWHIMKYYAHFGHTDFILCLGHYGEVIRRYVRDHEPYISYDFVPFPEGEKPLKPIASGTEEWDITLVDTGTEACVGERLQAVQSHLEDESIFLANYADGVTDLHLPDMIDHFQRHDAPASFVSVEPFHSFHTVASDANGTVQDIRPAAETGLRINGGYFVLTPEIFEYMEPGDELVEEPFRRLIREQRLITYEHNGFWGCMDTPKDKKHLEELYQCGKAPWEVWKSADRLTSLCPSSSSEPPPAAASASYQDDREVQSDHWGDAETLKHDSQS